MKYTTLPNTDLKVSKICLGTMTWGEQNTEKEAHEQLNIAIENGINFIDTAELYAIPIKAETQGLTEKYIGSWLKNQKREDLVIASKAAGPMPNLKHIRNIPNFSKEHIKQAVEGSLTRLQTDYIDLYQLHWPERITNFFGTLGYKHVDEEIQTNFKEILETLKELIIEGKIRHIGLSNETPWGVMQFLKYAEECNLPRVISIQNPYSLINRVFEIGLAEFAMRENTPLLAYSPLGGGLLSGKYLKSNLPEGSRYQLYPNYFSRYKHGNTNLAVEAYNKLAKESGVSLTQLSLAFINSREFLLSNIVGATKIEQLKENIGSIEIELSKDVVNEIEKIHLLFPNPAP
ncbi:MAG: aldo/keto reductase [Solirubrobacteraceae bacterium]